ncbi:MAG: 4a-hydroxytetrahydrobiopterin dehydratase [Alphaproteobacteria bacterium]
MPRRRLTDDERLTLFADLPHWRAVAGRDAMERRLRFRSFSQAWSFMSRVALAAEALDHHPEWSNVYGRVTIVLTTHTPDDGGAGGLSDLDDRLARWIEDFARPLAPAND